MNNLGNLADKTIFLRPSFKVMGNSRKVANSEVLNTDANSKLLKVQKALLDSPELEAIKKADGKIRTYLYEKCLPYDMGIYLLPLALLETVNARLADYQSERKELVSAFVSAYPSLCEKAATNLGSLYNAMDYPTASEVENRFSFDWQYVTFMTPETLKMTGMYEAEKAKAVEKMEQAAQEITLLMRETLLELVEHLKTSLEPNADGKPKRLFSSAVTNIQDFLETFKARNITNDTELDTLADEVSKLIHPGVSADMLKKDEDFKKTVHDGMENLTGKLTTLVENVPGRKFRE